MAFRAFLLPFFATGGGGGGAGPVRDLDLAFLLPFFATGDGDLDRERDCLITEVCVKRHSSEQGRVHDSISRAYVGSHTH